MLLFFCLSFVKADNYYVDAQNGSDSTGNGLLSQPWKTINYSIQHISGHGHNLYIAKGTYYENIVLDKRINLIGEGAPVTKIIAQSEWSVHTLIDIVGVGGPVRIEGLTIDGNNIMDYGIESDNAHQIINNNIIKCTKIGIRNWFSAVLTIRGNKIINNGTSQSSGTSGLNLIANLGTISDPGFNEIYNNGSYDVEAWGDMSAELNWWGQSPPDSGQFYRYDVDFDPWLTAPPLVINNGDTLVNNKNVVLLININQHLPGDTKIQFSNDNVNWTDAESLITSKQWVLSNGDGIKAVYAQFRDYENNIKYTKIFSSIVLDLTPPIGSLIINGEDSATKSPEVNLNINSIDITSGMGQGAEMQFSNDNFSWSDPEPYTDSKIWNLTSGDGLKTIYMKLKDVAGNWSETISESILLDTTPPEGTIMINNNQEIAQHPVIEITSDIYDDGSGMNDNAMMQFSNDNIAFSTPETYKTHKTWILPGSEGLKTVYAKFCDAVGNWTHMEISDNILLELDQIKIYVDDNGNNDTGDGSQNSPYKTITYALTKTTDPSKLYSIHVAQGQYNTDLGESFPIIIKNGVSLIGNNHNNTILDAGNNERVIKAVGINIPSTKISGFTIKNGCNSDGGAGIFITAGSSLIVENNIIMDNSVPVRYISTSPKSESGGGIYILNSSPEIKNNQILNNWTGATDIYKTGSGGYGGGIAISGSASLPLIENNIVSSNKAINTSYASGFGGGIYIGNNASAILTGNIISDNLLHQRSATSGPTYGGGIYISNSSQSTVIKNKISNNYAMASYGSISECSGIYVNNSEIKISNNIISQNDFSGISLNQSSPNIINNTIVFNEQDGIFQQNSCSPVIMNNIIAYNSKFGIREFDISSSPDSVFFNLFYINESGLYLDQGELEYYFVEDLDLQAPESSNNLSGDPLFVNLDSENYHLLTGSPAVNAGNPDPQYNDIDGSRNDIGAYGGEDYFVNIYDEKYSFQILERNNLIHNYPNPFNSITSIIYQLHKDSYAVLKIYNIHGQLVKTLIEGKQREGSYKIQWNGIDENGNSVAEGLYIYHLTADGLSQSNKMILIR